MKFSVARVKRDKYYQEYLASEDIRIEGVVETLSELAPHYKMAIITTSKQVDFDLIHRNKSIVKFMDFVLTREDYDRSKPDPEPYLTGLKRLGATSSEVVVVEDSARGLKSAIATNIDCIVVKNEFTKSNDFTGAVLKIESLKELPLTIKKFK
ncbi:HAD family hydrolase [Psychromonas sp. KJ10-10]|uniref:HAD family hydrolase n=1 Tax=Psychromonas sp. KJ10-10 TaxID=3391823 RepID=UPI0039B3EEEA